MPEKIRLVVWDLDETFWQGTLTEGKISYIKMHHDIVLELARRGIVSSICSKNDLEPVKALLQQHGLWDYIIFPTVNWDPKGARIAAMIEAVQLRPTTVMFIDDNPHNLQEALAHTSGLQIAGPQFIAAMLDDPRFRGKNDRALTRLAQYKLLERRQEDMRAGRAPGATGDNLKFLRASGIRVSIEHDVAAHLDRAIELINRTNQLNFTKQRLPEDLPAARAELLERLTSFAVQAGLVKVADSYGDYGYVGFYLVSGPATKKRLEYFCFSCRILGMSVERWFYDLLGRPMLAVRGEVAVDIFQTAPRPDWMQLAGASDEDIAQAPVPQVPSIRIRSGCNGEALLHYCQLASPDVRGEFNLVHAGNQVRLDHSSMLRLSVEGPRPERLAALAPLGITAAHLKSRLFEPALPGTVWVFSNWIDATIFVYRHKALNFLVPFVIRGFGRTNLITAPDDRLRARFLAAGNSEADLEQMFATIAFLRSEFVCDGIISDADMTANLRLIFSQLPADGRMCVLLAVEDKMPLGPNLPMATTWQAPLNRLLRAAAADFSNVTLLDVGAFVHEASEMQDTQHFDRMVYYRMFKTMMAALSGPAPAAALGRHAAA